MVNSLNKYLDLKRFYAKKYLIQFCAILSENEKILPFTRISPSGFTKSFGVVLKSRKVIIVAPYHLDRVGGVERFILSFAEAAQNIGMSCVIYNPLGFVSKSLNVIHEIDDNEYDLCLSHAIYGLGAMPKAYRRVHTFHGTILGNLYQRPWLWIHPKFLQWLAMESASRRGKDGVIGVSDWAIREIHRMGYRGPVSRIPSGGGFEAQRIKRPKSSGNESELLCLFCGRSSDKVKRFNLIREGIRLVRKKIRIFDY